MPRTLLLTRARAQAEGFAELVQQNTDFQCHIAPMQEMRDLLAEIDLSGVDALVFTSVNGVKSFARRWDVRDIPAYCVGPATANAAAALGMDAQGAKGNSQSLAALVNNANLQNPLHIHGLHKAAELPINAASIAIYEQVALPLNVKTQNILANGIDAVALFSPRSAQLLADVWQDNWPAPVFYCISKATAEPVKNIGNIHVSAQPNAKEMLALLID